MALGSNFSQEINFASDEFLNVYREINKTLQLFFYFMNLKCLRLAGMIQWGVVQCETYAKFTYDWCL